MTAHVFGFPADGAAFGCRGDLAAGLVCGPVARYAVGRQILFAFYPNSQIPVIAPRTATWRGDTTTSPPQLGTSTLEVAPPREA